MLTGQHAQRVDFLREGLPQREVLFETHLSQAPGVNLVVLAFVAQAQQVVLGLVG